MIILRTPKGWTGPKEVDGHKVEGFWRAHQVPVLDVKSNPEHLRIVEQWMRSYRPEELFDEHGTLIPELRDLPPGGRSPHERQPARQRRQAAQSRSSFQTFATMRSPSTAQERRRSHPRKRSASFYAM